PSQTLRAAAARYDAEIDFRLPERCFLAGDANVASQSDFTSTPEAVTINHRDNRFGKSTDGVEQRTFQHHFALIDRGALGKLGNVRAGNKSLIAGAGEDDYANGFI